jgi:hypothetical protein
MWGGSATPAQPWGWPKKNKIKNLGLAKGVAEPPPGAEATPKGRLGVAEPPPRALGGGSATPNRPKPPPWLSWGGRPPPWGKWGGRTTPHFFKI